MTSDHQREDDNEKLQLISESMSSPRPPPPRDYQGTIQHIAEKPDNMWQQ